MAITKTPAPSGPGSAAVAYVRCRIGGATYWGAGQDTSVLTASVRAVLSAVNRVSALPSA